MDDLISLDDLQEKVAGFEDYVQSSDIAAMQSKSIHHFRSLIPPSLTFEFPKSCDRRGTSV